MYLIQRVFVGVVLLAVSLLLCNCSDKSTKPDGNIKTWQYAFVSDVPNQYGDVVSVDNNEIIAAGDYNNNIHVARLDHVGNHLWSKDFIPWGQHENWIAKSIYDWSNGLYRVMGETSTALNMVTVGDLGESMGLTVGSPDSGLYYFANSLLLNDDGGQIMIIPQCDEMLEVHHIEIIWRKPDGILWSIERIPFPGMLGLDLISALTSNGNILLVGEILNGNNSDIYNLVIDSSGNIISQSSFGTSLDDIIRDVQSIGNDRFLAVGGSSSGDSSGERCIYLAKLDSDGDMIWDKRIGSGNLYGRTIVAAADGNFVIGADKLSEDRNLTNVCLIKIDPSGTVLWEKSLEAGPYESFCHGLTETSDGGFVVAGLFRGYGSQGNNRYIAKTDAEGNCVDSIKIIEE